ncbi:CENP-B protein [Zopfia rhizophila CBS 207.26]|uniref:CENP-B protein n=1 Tax=Zopfia rhizophila CBS 207.26 TaxID=1314779 RepID=A0A6A6EUG6_9PEZI|nr:CENP-B protein [Zopfia rhizophila CBS 207.26]
MDEVGCALGVCTNCKVLGDLLKKRTLLKSPQDRKWVLIIEAISADGRCIRPVAIFKGKNPQASWFTAQNIPDWHYTTSENGWTSNYIALHWLHEVFLPET